MINTLKKIGLTVREVGRGIVEVTQLIFGLTVALVVYGTAGVGVMFLLIVNKPMAKVLYEDIFGE